MWFFDSLQNLLSGMGVEGRDKTVSTTFTFTLLSQQTLEAAYRGDWIARKVIDIPAMDATRAWRQWQATEDQITALELEESRHGLQRKIKSAMQRARLYGGAAIVMGVGTDDPGQPLNLDLVRKGDLRFLHVLSRYELRTGTRITDLESPWFGEPEYYERNVAGDSTGAMIRIHPSRVVRLLGAELPSSQLTLAMQLWGDSSLQAVDDAIRQAGIVTGGIATMVQEAKIDVIRIPDLSKKITTKDYKDKLTARFQYANVAKSIVNTLVLDKDEEWQRIEQGFQTLPDVLKMYLLVASGAADIPATRMLGQSPVGLSATGESDVRNYYDRISSEQKNELMPALARLDEVLIRSALGKRDPKIHYWWHPLWQLSDTEKAAVAKSKAEAFKTDMDAGALDPDVLRIARENQLVEDGTYPGIEAVIEDARNARDALEESDGEVQAQFTTSSAAAGAAAGLIQKQALNGGQITSLASLVEMAANASLPKESVKAMIAVSFPTISDTEIDAIIDPIVPAPQEPIPPLVGKLVAGETPAAIPTAPGEDPKGSTPGAASRPGDPAQAAGNAPAAPREGDIVQIRRANARDGVTEDAKPRTAYVRRDVVNADDIVAWAKEQGFATTVPPDEMHVTVLYSKQAFDWMEAGTSWSGRDGELTVDAGGPRMVEPLGDEGAVCLLFACSELQWRHDDMVDNGASHDYDEYQPHVTVTYKKPDDLDLETVVPYQGRIVLGPEIWEEITEKFDPADLAEDSRHNVEMERNFAVLADAVKLLAEQQPPVVNVHVDPPPARRVVKDMDYDEKNRVTRITEREEDTE